MEFTLRGVGPVFGGNTHGSRVNFMNCCTLLTHYVVFCSCKRCCFYMEVYDKFDGTVIVPRLDVRPALEKIRDMLGEVKIAGRLLESSMIHTLVHMPFIVSCLLKKFEPSNNSRMEPPLITDVRASLYNSINRRLGKHLTDADQPSLIAALLFPSYSMRLDTFGVLRPTQQAVLRNLDKWIDEMSHETSRDHSPNDDDDNDRPTTTLLDDLPVVPTSRPSPPSSVQVKGALRTAINDLSRKNMIDAHYPLPSFSLLGANGLNASVDYLDRFYNSDAKYAPLHPLLYRVFSLSGSEAGAEQAFSVSGRFDSPLRNRLDPNTLEMLTGK